MPLSERDYMRAGKCRHGRMLGNCDFCKVEGSTTATRPRPIPRGRPEAPVNNWATVADPQTTGQLYVEYRMLKAYQRLKWKRRITRGALVLLVGAVVGVGIYFAPYIPTIYRLVTDFLGQGG